MSNEYRGDNVRRAPQPDVGAGWDARVMDDGARLAGITNEGISVFHPYQSRAQLLMASTFAPERRVLSVCA